MPNKKIYISFLFFNIVIFLFFSLFISLYSLEGLPVDGNDFKNFTTIFNFNYKLPYLLDKPLGEDAFYLILAASNLADGKGLTVNFNEPITGIQPLIVFIYAFIIKITNLLGLPEIIFLRIIVFFNSILILFFCFNLFKISNLFSFKEDKELNLVLSIIFTLFSFHIYRMFLYGLETSLYLSLLSFFIYKFIKIKRLNKFSIHDSFILGVIIGLTGLARIDFGIFYFCILIFCLFNFRLYFFQNLFVGGGIGAIIVFTWLFYVYTVSGSFLPSSGTAQSLLINSENYLSRINEMIASITQNLLSIIYIFGLNLDNFLKTYFEINGTFLNTLTGNLPTSRSYLSIISLMLISIILFYGNKIFINSYLKDFKEILPAMIILILVYLIFFWPEHFYKRYSSVILIFSIPLMVILISNLIKKTKYKIHSIFFLNILVILLFSLYSYQSYFKGRIANLQSITTSNVDANKYNKIGSFQSGVFAFVHRNVINLDGKANFKIINSIKNNNIDDYLITNKDIDFIIDWPSYINKYISDDYLKKNWKICFEKKYMLATGYCRIN